MIKKSQFGRLIKSVVEYNMMLQQFQDEYGDNEIAKFGDGPCAAILEFLEDVMDDEKREILDKLMHGIYKKKLLCIKEGKYYDLDYDCKDLEGYKRIQIRSISQLYDFLKKKKEESCPTPNEGATNDGLEKL